METDDTTCTPDVGCFVSPNAKLYMPQLLCVALSWPVTILNRAPSPCLGRRRCPRPMRGLRVCVRVHSADSSQDGWCTILCNFTSVDSFVQRLVKRSDSGN